MIRGNSLLTVMAWCLYDWAAASFSIIVVTFIFATYYTTIVAENQIIGTYQWANAVALASAIIAIISPIVGAIADYGGYHKRWLLLFTSFCILSSAALWFAYPTHAGGILLLMALIIGTIGFEIALVFYNAYLPGLVQRKYIGRISGWGWGAGYLGGIIALSLALVVFVHNGAWLGDYYSVQIRICGPFVAAWYFIFSLPFFLLAPTLPSSNNSMVSAIKLGCGNLWHTIKLLPSQKNVSLYLFAHMVYTDGLNTLFAFGGIYAAGTYGFSFEEVLLFGISINVAAGIGSFFFSWIDDQFGAKRTIILSLCFLTIAGGIILLLTSKTYFWLTALFACLFVGPIQSASRSLMIHLVADKRQMTKIFGLYALSGRATSFIGPWLLGVTTYTFGSQRAGMATILLFFILGTFLLIPIKVPEATLE